MGHPQVSLDRRASVVSGFHASSHRSLLGERRLSAESRYHIHRIFFESLEPGLFALRAPLCDMRPEGHARHSVYGDLHKENPRTVERVTVLFNAEDFKFLHECESAVSGREVSTL